MKRRLLLSILFCVLFLGVNAQKLYPEVYSSLGGYSTNSVGSLTFTAGEPLYVTASGSQNTLTQGFNQSIVVLENTDIKDENRLDVPIKLFPNPAESVLHLEIEQDYVNNLTYELLDINTKTLIKKSIQGTTQTIDLSKYAAGMYLFQITDKNTGKSKSFKIQKIK